MSKRGNKSLIKINQAKAVSGGSGRNIAPWLKKKKNLVKPLIPNYEELAMFKSLGITFIDKPEEFEINRLKIEVSKKVYELSTVEKEREPHKLKLEKKNKEELVRMIHIVQNRIIKILKN